MTFGQDTGPSVGSPARGSESGVAEQPLGTRRANTFELREKRLFEFCRAQLEEYSRGDRFGCLGIPGAEHGTIRTRYEAFIGGARGGCRSRTATDISNLLTVARQKELPASAADVNELLANLELLLQYASWFIGPYRLPIFCQSTKMFFRSTAILL